MTNYQQISFRLCGATNHQSCVISTYFAFLPLLCAVFTLKHISSLMLICLYFWVENTKPNSWWLYWRKSTLYLWSRPYSSLHRPDRNLAKCSPEVTKKTRSVLHKHSSDAWTGLLRYLTSAVKSPGFTKESYRSNTGYFTLYMILDNYYVELSA